MRVLWLGAGIFALATWSVQPAAAQPAADHGGNEAVSPAALLARAAKASRTTNFEGVLVYRSDGTMEVLHVTHRFKDGQQSEHLVMMTGVPRELIRQGDRLTCVLPRGHQVSLRQPQVKRLMARLDGPELAKVGKWYEFLSMEPERVAGRECLGVAVKPRDAYRYGYRVWLDKKTNVPLRVMLVGNDAQVLEQVMFTQVAFPEHIPDSAFQSEFTHSGNYHVVRKKIPADTARDTATGSVSPVADDGADLWRFSKLPPGFSVTMRDRRPMPDSMGQVNHIMLTDGLSAISVFGAQAVAGQPALEGVSHVGAVHAYGRLLDGYHITVVGEAPARTVRMIGEALEPVSARSVHAPPATVAATGSTLKPTVRAAATP